MLDLVTSSFLLVAEVDAGGSGGVALGPLHVEIVPLDLSRSLIQWDRHLFPRELLFSSLLGHLGEVLDLEPEEGWFEMVSRPVGHEVHSFRVCNGPRLRSRLGEGGAHVAHGVCREGVCGGGTVTYARLIYAMGLISREGRSFWSISERIVACHSSNCRSRFVDGD